MANSDFDITDAALTVGVGGIAGGIAYLAGNFISAFTIAVSGATSPLAAVPYNLLMGAGVFGGLAIMEIRKMYRSWKASQ